MHSKGIVGLLSIFLTLSTIFFVVIIPETTEASGPYITDAWYNVVTNIATTTECGAITGESYQSITPGHPTLLPNGTIFMQLSLGSSADGSDRRIFYVKSYDNGSTWTDPLVLVMGHETLDTWGCLFGFTFMANGKLYLFTTNDCYNQPLTHTYHYLIYSEDYGTTWTGLDSSLYINGSAVNLTSVIQDGATWDRVVTEEGRQISSGRVVVVGWVMQTTSQYDVVTLYTDDISNFSANDWVYCTEYGTAKEFTENHFIELNDGSLYRTIRGNRRSGGIGRRHYSFCSNPDALDIAWTENGQEGTHYFPYHPDMLDPECDASIQRWTATDDGYEKDRIVISWNNESSTSRIHLTVGISYNECQTSGYNSGFNVTRELNSPQDAWYYPRMLVTSNKTIFLTNGYTTNLTAVQFNLEWASDGYDTLNYTASDDSTISFQSINGQANNSILQDDNRTFIWEKVSSAIEYSIRVGNSTVGSSVTEVFLQLDNISEGCALEGMPGGDYFENATHVTFILPDQYNITAYNYHYYQVRAYTT